MQVFGDMTTSGSMMTNHSSSTPGIMDQTVASGDLETKMAPTTVTEDAGVAVTMGNRNHSSTGHISDSVVLVTDAPDTADTTA